MSNIIILSLIGLGLVTSFSFIYSVKHEFKVVEFSEIKGSESLLSKTLEVGEFYGIDTYDQVKVFISQGPSNVEISAEDNLLEFLKVDNEDGVLKIYMEQENRQHISRTLPMIVKISNPKFESIKANQQSEIQIEGKLNQERISILLENQSNLRGAMEIDSIDLSLEQQSNAYITGTCEILNIDLKDQSGIKAGALLSQVVNIQLNDQTDAKLNAVKSISGSVRNNASLALENKPEENSISKSKMATVHLGRD